MSYESSQGSVDVKKTVIIGGHGENPNPSIRKEKKAKLPEDMRAFAADTLRNGGTAQELKFAKDTLLSHGYRWNDDDPDQSYQEVMAIVEKSKAAGKKSAEDYVRQNKLQGVWQEMEQEDDRKRAKIQAELRAAQPSAPAREAKMKDVRMIDLNELQAAQRAELAKREEGKNPVKAFFKKLFG